jgi:hypothetical protein
MKRKALLNGEIQSRQETDNLITTVGYLVTTYLPRACAYCNNSPIEYDVTRDQAIPLGKNRPHRLSVQKRYLDNENVIISQTL